MQEQEKLLSKDFQKEDEKEYQLRPQTFENYIGQDALKENLKIFIASAKKRRQPLDHVLLFGPPGLGKTTLAGIIAKELGCNLRGTSGPVIEKQGDLAAILTSLEPGQVLFIDEIHRMSRVIEEVLYSAMEDFTLDIMIGQGPSARTIKLDLPRFTLIGATTRTGLISSPLRERFGIPLHFDYYQPEELKEIIMRSAEILDAQIMDKAALELAGRSRGTPRIANRLLKRALDFAVVKTDSVITFEIVQETLSRLDIDEMGLDKMDKRILTQIIENHQGGPVGIGTIAATISEEVDTIEEVVEPYLLKIGFLKRTPRGRVATPKAYAYLGISLETNEKISWLDSSL
ncbi:MAG: Holliday junction branch migration DNA helicase RuvB [Deltaproteobacteria bacterium]|nr:Holliday junction branch migration DNA helicase RuvB [Deltaproteobacteria bacterium]